MSAAVKVPHVHAELIKQWADGAKIEYRKLDAEDWVFISTPIFAPHTQYRVKPELPAKVYPVTGMTDSEFDFICSRDQTSLIEDCRDSANAALRHAYDANEILTLADHQAAIAAFGVKLRDAASGREMAIAEAVRDRLISSVAPSLFTSEVIRLNSISLADAIAQVSTC